MGKTGVSPVSEHTSTSETPIGSTGKTATRQENALTFHAMDPRADIQITRRNLPHWQQDGATYFVTFRLADAIPASLLKQWKEEFENWKKFHPEPWDGQTKHEYQERFQDGREQWLDQGHGACLLERP